MDKGGVGRRAQHRFGRWRSLIILARLDQLGVNRRPKLLVACFPLLLVHVCLLVHAVTRRRRTPRATRPFYSELGIVASIEGENRGSSLWRRAGPQMCLSYLLCNKCQDTALALEPTGLHSTRKLSPPTTS